MRKSPDRIIQSEEMQQEVIDVGACCEKFPDAIRSALPTVLTDYLATEAMQKHTVERVCVGETHPSSTNS